MKDDKDLRIEELESEKKEWIERHHNALKYAESNLDKLTATTQALDAAVEVIEAALRLQDLWLYHGKISVEHAHEANALNLMKHRFEESLEKIKALKGVE